MGSLGRSLNRKIKKRRSKMSIMLPVKKIVREVKLTNVQVVNPSTGIPTGERESRTEKVVLRNDGEVFLAILSNIDFNKSDKKKQRRNATKLIDKFQDWNFENEASVTVEDELEITDGQLEDLYDLCIKDVPDSVQIAGGRVLRTLDAFEDWYDEREREKKKKEEEGREKEKEPSQGE
jgi:hypothetical protein